jgi:hypothetical protein
MSKTSRNKKIDSEVLVEAAVTEIVDTDQVAAIEALEEMIGKDLEVVDGELTIVEEAPAVTIVGDVHPLLIIEGQLNIYENRVLNVPAGARVTVVENLGFGDMYVDNTSVQYTSKYVITPGEKKEYKGAKSVFLGSASRPNYRISFYK